MQDSTRSGVVAVERGLALFLAILDDADAPLSRLAARTGVPVSTAHRMVGALLRQGLLSRTGRGGYAPGLRLAGVADRVSTRAVLAQCSRPILRQLARALQATVHLGVLEGDMVTYLVKEHAGGTTPRTREGMQLEAYCTSIGKVLLAHLGEDQRTRYLAAGPFVRLTAATITNPALLRAHLQGVADQGFAVDLAEFEDGLHCVAVPVRGPGNHVVAALSASGFAGTYGGDAWLTQLQRGASRIGRNLGAVQSVRPRIPPDLIDSAPKH